MRENAESAIKQKIVFYYILREEKLTPTGEDYDKIYNVIFDEHLQSYLDYYEITESTENYDALVEEAKMAIKSQFGESYWFELVAYDYMMKEMIANANVTYK